MKTTLIITFTFFCINLIGQVVPEPPPVNKITVATSENDVVYDIVEEPASFPGGMKEMMKYIFENVKYPEIARSNGIQGRVYVQFVVFKDSSIKDVRVIKGYHSDLDKEAVRVIKNMPNWIPGKQKGKAVNSKFTIPISFKLEK